LHAYNVSIFLRTQASSQAHTCIRTLAFLTGKILLSREQGAIEEAKRTDRFYAENMIREESLLLIKRDVLEKYTIQRLCTKRLVTNPLNLAK